MVYNWLLENLILPLGDWLLGTSFIKELRHWRSISQMNERELEELQSRKLRGMLLHAQQTVPYYQHVNLDVNQSPADWLRQFPILSKTMLKGNETAFISQKFKNHRLIKASSSGSSGFQISVWINKKELSVYRAIQVLWWEWAGYKMGMKLLQTGMAEKRTFVKAVKDKLLRTHYFQAFNLNEGTISSLLKRMQPTAKVVLAGYASSLYEIARIAKRQALKNLKVHAVISWGDKMFPHYRALIEKELDAKVYDTYACAEMILVAAQCDTPYYYIMSPHVVVEIVDGQGNPVPDGVMGRVLVTRLDGLAMPLIRYELGDLAIKLPRVEYPSNRKLSFPLLKSIIGRDTDVVYTRSGKALIVHFFTGIFEYIPEIRQFMVFQSNLDGIRIDFISDKGFHTGILEIIEKKITQYLGEPFQIEFNHVKEIPSTPSGKPQIIQSALDETQRVIVSSK